VSVSCQRTSTVALLSIVPLGAIVCGENTQDRSATSRYFSHQILAQVVQYLAWLWYNIWHGCGTSIAAQLSGAL
jgi:hypothetical protein